MRAIPREQTVSITLNGVRRIVLSCSPGDLAALTVGHLLTEGWIRDVADVHSLIVEDTGAHTSNAVVEVPPEQVEMLESMRRHQTEHGCGLRHVLDCEPRGIAPVRGPDAPIDAPVLLRALFAAADQAAPDGGVHAAALSDGFRLDVISVDVARHCAVDRAVGTGAREHGLLDAYGVVCSARISGGMALKAVHARLGWIASRSVATSLAHEIAEAHGLLLLEGGRTSQTAR